MVPASIRRWESALVDRVAAGDDSALATIYDQFGALVYGIACRVAGSAAAVQITQDVFAAVWDHPEQFTGEQRALRTGLASHTRRRAREVLSARRSSVRAISGASDGWLDAPFAIAPDIDEAALAMFAADRLRTALAQLPHDEREAVELAYRDGLTFRELAVRMGTSEEAAVSRLRMGLERLARALGDRGRVDRS
jgi:RNA polymerase sigma-70 factor, ECF subfamily